MKNILIALLLLISTNVVNHVYAQVRSDLRQRIGEIRKNNIDRQFLISGNSNKGNQVISDLNYQIE